MKNKNQKTKEWEIKKLGDICEVIAGQSPESKFYNSDKKGLPFYQGKKLYGEKYLKKPNTWTTKITKRAQKDDILMSVRAPVGPLNLATEDICIGRGLAAIRVSDLIELDLLWYFLKSFESNIIGHSGAVFNSINKKQIEDIAISFPESLDEQKRIVGILDEAFENIDQAKTIAEQNLKNIEELFESELQNIFSNNGGDWETDLLLNLTSKIGSGATPRGGKKSYKKEGISLIRSMNVHDRFFKEKNLAFIDDNQASLLGNVSLEDKDVLLNITGASVARCCVVPRDYLPARVNQHVSIIRPNKNLNNIFLNYLLTSKPYKDVLLGIGEQGSTRQAITKSQIESLSISFPGINEQQKIVERLDELKEKVDEGAAILRSKIAALDELKKSLLQKTFNGEL